MISDPEQHELAAREQERIANVLALIPDGCQSLLEIGVRSGYMTRMLANRAGHVTALDLTLPQIEGRGITAVQGDVTSLVFGDASFDVVVCTEVLEHIPHDKLERACTEMARVARGHVIIGVPYRQDIRHGRTTCASCGKRNPPWGHVNSFDERLLAKLFPDLVVERMCFVGETNEKTNAVSVWLLDMAGNPYGTYEQEERCIYCHASLVRPSRRTLASRVLGRLAVTLQRMQRVFSRPTPIWLHVLLSKQGTVPSMWNDGA